MPTTPLVLENTPFVSLNWTDFGLLCDELGNKVVASGKKFDRLVPLANGGLTAARALADYVGTSVITPLQVTYYTGINERQREPIILQPLPVSVAGEHLLVVEDVVDTGATLAHVQVYLQSLGAASITIATLVQKPSAAVKAEIWALESTGWIIFPYEKTETRVDLTSRWQKQGVAPDHQISYLEQLGLQ